MSYAAGERSALLKAFREVLPAQQTLGALQSSVTQVLEGWNIAIAEARIVKCAVSALPYLQIAAPIRVFASLMLLH